MERNGETRRKAVLIVNLFSRFGFVGVETAKASLERQGVQVSAAFGVHSPGRIPMLVRRAVESGAKLVVVGGGDGTIAAAVDSLAYSDTALGILPLGTGNDFARALGIPRGLRRASRIIAEGKVGEVNLGRVNGDYFVNSTSVGFPARISRRTNGWMKQWLGFGAYALGAFLEFWTYRPFHVRLIVDDVEREVQTSMVIVWNGRFHAGWKLASPEKTQSQRLLAYAPAVSSRLGLLQMALALRLGGLAKTAPLLTLEAETVSIEADPPQDVDVDGEILHRSPATIRLARRALKVIVPEEFTW